MSDEAVAQKELPKYRCHKEVHALKIKGVYHRAILESDVTKDIVQELHFENEGYGPVKVDSEFMRQYGPHVGGYYVVYADGYVSFSPAAAFEAGYTRI